MITLEKKKEIVDIIYNKINIEPLFIFCNFKGIKVSLITELKKKLANINSNILVYKNTLIKRALNNAEFDYPKNLLKEHTSLIIANKDTIIKVAKEIKEFSDKVETFEIKGGFFEKNFCTSDQIKQLATLPSKEVLLAKLICVLKSPLYSMVMTCSGTIRNLVYVLSAIKNKKTIKKEDLL
jgi:large subunit ribosomal protein L10